MTQTNETPEKILALARKLKALADQGVGGEKETAERMLARLMKEHNISEFDISGEELKIHWFKVTKEQDKLFTQLVAHIRRGADMYVKRHKGPKNEQGVKLTASEAIQLYALFEWHWAQYQRELKTFHTAYVIRHELFSSGPSVSPSELTPEQRAERLRANIMAEGLSDETYHKQLENSKNGK